MGPIDVWVNAAMATIFAPRKDHAGGISERATRVTYLGQVHGTMAALKGMRPRNCGTIVNVGSALAYGWCHCNRRIAAPRRRCAVSPIACGRNSSTTR